jgi:hypothetical protein
MRRQQVKVEGIHRAIAIAICLKDEKRQRIVRQHRVAGGVLLSLRRSKVAT